MAVRAIGDGSRSDLRALCASRALPARRVGSRSRPRACRELRLARPAGAHGRARTEFYWEGERGTGAALASALRGWEHLRFEVTEDAGLGTDGGRWMHTPDLGIFFAQTDTAGNIVIPEDRIRYAMEIGRLRRVRAAPRAARRARSGVGRRARAVPSRQRGQPGRLAAQGGLAPMVKVITQSIARHHGSHVAARSVRRGTASGRYVPVERTHPWFELRAQRTPSSGSTARPRGLRSTTERDDGVVAAEAERVADRQLRLVAERCAAP